MPQETPPNQWMPRDIEHLLGYLSEAVPSIDPTRLPTMIGVGNTVLVSHQVSDEKLGQSSNWQYLKSIIGYVSLGAKPFLLLQTLANTQPDPNMLQFIVPSLREDNAYFEALLPQLEELRDSIFKAPLTTLPLWVALDVLPITLITPLGLETILGTATTLVISQLVWARRVRKALRHLNAGNVELIENPSLQGVEESLRTEDYRTALIMLDESDGIPENNPRNKHYTLATLHLAETIALYAQEGSQELNLGKRIETVAQDIGSRFPK